ncbi:hypothetical protein GCM10007424_14680 [Flavobacterium suaedae]|uniref:Uncharacterized protein n=1 Tax=Flavobacterium suaedae TaxID=1767027 RepID=A0ABQ1JT74_9FLAO|nr:hypothetical protein GCM10007424_14680 [Flavobacterium suaedae]
MIPCLVFCQTEISLLEEEKVDSSIEYNGKLQKAVLYTDDNGDHIVILSETGGVPSKKDEDYQSAELYAYQYSLIRTGKWVLDWRMYDFEKECPLDLICNFIPNSFAITDLNINGKAEVWLTYQLVCTGDISPSTMKVIMYENGVKYAMRGERKVILSENPDTTYGGEFNFDSAFKNAPLIFREYANRLWDKHVIMNWE